MARSVESFRYKARSQADYEKRATQQGGDFASFLKDEYRTFKPKAGENGVRFYPNTWDEEPKHFGIDIWVHYDVGPERASVLCLNKMKGEPCPVCEAKVRAENNDDQDLVDKLKPRHRVAYWVDDLNDRPAGPLIWCPGWTVDRDIVKASKDRSSNKILQIDDPYEGYDMFFERVGTGRNTEYTAWQPAREATALNKRKFQYVLDNPLPECMLWRDYDEVRRIFTGGVETSRRGSGRDDDDHQPRRRPARDDDRRRRDPDDEPMRRSRDPDDEPVRRGRGADDEPREGRRRPARDPDDEPLRRPSREDDRGNPWDEDDPGYRTSEGQIMRRSRDREDPRDYADDPDPRSARAREDDDRTAPEAPPADEPRGRRRPPRPAENGAGKLQDDDDGAPVSNRRRPDDREYEAPRRPADDWQDDRPSRGSTVERLRDRLTSRERE